MLMAIRDVRRRCYEKGWITTRPGNISMTKREGKYLYNMYRARFLGHGCCRIGPDLQGALVGDQRSYANYVRRVFVTTQ